MNQLLKDIVEPQIEEAIREYHLGAESDYTYEVSLDLMPVQDQMAPTLCILLCVPNPAELGHKSSAMTFIPGPFPETGQVKTAITGLIEGLAEMHKSALVLP